MIEKFVLKFGFEKGVFLTKLHFYIKRSMEISGKGLLHFYQQPSFMIGNQTNHRTNAFLVLFNSRYESDYECICIVINGIIRSVPLNILSSVFNVDWLLKLKVYTQVKNTTSETCAIFACNFIYTFSFIV